MAAGTDAGGSESSDGYSLFSELPGGDRAVYIETEMPLSLAGWSPLRGLRTHTHKYILAPSPELYDLLSDPSESRNLYEFVVSDVEARHARVVEVASGVLNASSSWIE